MVWVVAAAVLCLTLGGSEPLEISTWGWGTWVLCWEPKLCGTWGLPPAGEGCAGWERDLDLSSWEGFEKPEAMGYA